MGKFDTNGRAALLRTVAAGAMLLAPVTAFAQAPAEARADDERLEVIVVQARRRELVALVNARRLPVGRVVIVRCARAILAARTAAGSSA